MTSRIPWNRTLMLWLLSAETLSAFLVLCVSASELTQDEAKQGETFFTSIATFVRLMFSITASLFFGTFASVFYWRRVPPSIVATTCLLWSVCWLAMLGYHCFVVFSLSGDLRNCGHITDPDSWCKSVRLSYSALPFLGTSL